MGEREHIEGPGLIAKREILASATPFHQSKNLETLDQNKLSLEQIRKYIYTSRKLYYKYNL